MSCCLSRENSIFRGETVVSGGILGQGVSPAWRYVRSAIGVIMALGLASGRDSLEEWLIRNPRVLDEKTGLPKSLVTIREFYRMGQNLLAATAVNTCKKSW